MVTSSSEVRGSASEDVAIEVAERAHVIVDSLQARSVILVGGDTAEAFIGDNVVRVLGSIDVGVSVWATRTFVAPSCDSPAKPGAFGTANTLVDLVNEMTQHVPMAITMGDASGVGPEIVLRRAADGAFDDECVVVYGDAGDPAPRCRAARRRRDDRGDLRSVVNGAPVPLLGRRRRVVAGAPIIAQG